MFQRILVPIDGSKSAGDALLHALQLAKIHGSEVEVLHVMTFTEDLPPDVSAKKTSPPDWWIEDYISRVRKNDEKMLGDAIDLAKNMGLGDRVVSKLLIGKPGDLIVSEASQGGFDLVVIGSRGLGGIKELVLGSVSHKVVNESKVPVLVVK
jgi:nucleotide-binding universal stress UspA family protein